MNKQLTLDSGTKKRHTAEQQATAKAIAENPEAVGYALLDKKQQERQRRAEQRGPAQPLPLADLMPIAIKTFAKPTPVSTQTSLF